MMNLLYICAFVFFFTSCYHHPVKVSSCKEEDRSQIKCPPGEILVCKRIDVKEVEIKKVDPQNIDFSDFPMDEGFKRALDLNISYLSKLNKDFLYTIGDRKVQKDTLLNTTLKLKEILLGSKTKEEVKKKIIESFDLYEVLKGTESAFFSSYYEPVFEASLKRDDVYKYPIYRKPDDMIDLNLEEFDPERYKGQKLTGRLLGTKLVPYYTRAEIDFGDVFRGKGYEIAYLKDITDLLDLHTQGSGILKLKEGGYKRAKFAATNSLKFKGWMSVLVEKGYVERKGGVGQDRTFYDRARDFINKNPHLWKEIIGENKRYTFFSLDDVRSFDEGPIGTYGSNLVAHRSIAIDNSIIPLGMPAFISVDLPVINNNLDVVGFRLANRFVFCHDTGGAIKGARVDYFAGTGDVAKKFAYSLWKRGNLYLILLKEGSK